MPSVWLWPAAVMLVAAALRIYGLGTENLWIDEVFQVRRAARPVSDYVGGFWTLDPTKVDKSFLSLLIHHFVLELGDSEWLLRGPSVAFSLAEIVVLFLVAKRLTAARTATLAALFLALSPLHVWYAQEVRWYAQWSFFSSLSFLAFVTAWSTDSPKAWVGYGGALLLALASFPVTVLVIACQGLSALWLSLKRDRAWFLRRFLLVQAGVLVLLIVYVVGTARTAIGPVGTPRVFRLEALPFTFFSYVAGFSVGPTLSELHALPGLRRIFSSHPVVLVFAAVFAPLTFLGVGRIWKRSPTREFVLPWAFGLPLLVLFTDWASELVFNVRYALPSLPAFGLLLAVALDDPGHRRSRWVAGSMALACLTYALFNYHFVPRYDKADARSAVAAIRDGEHEASPVLVLGQVAYAVGYYGPDLQLRWLPDCEPRPSGFLETLSPEGTDRSGEAERLSPSTVRGWSSLWLVVGRDWQGAGDDCLRWLRRSHRIADTRRFTGVEAFRLQRKTSPTSAGGRERRPSAVAVPQQRGSPGTRHAAAPGWMRMRATELNEGREGGRSLVCNLLAPRRRTDVDLENGGAVTRGGRSGRRGPRRPPGNRGRLPGPDEVGRGLPTVRG